MMAGSSTMSVRPFTTGRALVSRPASAQMRTRLPSSRLMVRAEAEDEDDFEARIASLKRSKNEAAKKRADGTTTSSAPAKPAKKSFDYTNETLFFESTPHLGDVAVNLALGITLVWLPLSIASVGRAAFIKYRFTDRRISCITTAPWKNEQVDAAYQEVKDVVTIGRGIGLWGDMLVTLNDGSKIEMRALPRHVEMKNYILERRDALLSSGGGAAVSSDGGKGFAG